MTDAELAAIEARAAAATQAHNRLMLHAGYLHGVSVAPVTDDDATVRASRQDVPALVTALRELRAAARTLAKYDGGHGLDCPLSWATYPARAVCICGYEAAVAALAALVGEGRND